MYHAPVDLQREIRFGSALREPTEADLRRCFARLAEVLQASSLKWRGLLAKKDA